ncbi:hypothetical protein [Shewanella halifaxensis]|uniref:hypothetical protein n=1 Tax=Shewanella halifaxensis TaxID=271098 RepID=UPI000D593A27|nr:hypothetical protein [Shewanella halifaxensis]
MRVNKIEMIVREIIERVSSEIITEDSTTIDVELFRTQFFERVAECLSVLDYEYPIWSEKVSVNEVKRWSVFWLIETKMEQGTLNSLNCSVSLISNKKKILFVQYCPELNLPH